MSQVKLLFITFVLLFSTVARTMSFAERNLPLETGHNSFAAGSGFLDHVGPTTWPHSDSTHRRAPVSMAKLFFVITTALTIAPAAASAAFFHLSQFPSSYILPTPSRPPEA